MKIKLSWFKRSASREHRFVYPQFSPAFNTAPSLGPGDFALQQQSLDAPFRWTPDEPIPLGPPSRHSGWDPHPLCKAEWIGLKLAGGIERAISGCRCWRWGQQGLVPQTLFFQDNSLSLRGPSSQAMTSFTWNHKYFSFFSCFFLNASCVLCFLTTQAKTFAQMLLHSFIPPDTCLGRCGNQVSIPQMNWSSQRLRNLLKIPSNQVSGFLETGSGCG